MNTHCGADSCWIHNTSIKTEADEAQLALPSYWNTQSPSLLLVRVSLFEKRILCISKLEIVIKII